MFVTDLHTLTPSDFDRINVVGLSGSGKSTCARRFASIFESEHIEMDRLFHEPNWAEPDEHVFRQRIQDAIKGDRWVLDGNYHSKTHDLKWARVTAIVWIDTSYAQNMWQTFSRAMNRAWTQEELWPDTGNRESFQRAFFSRKSIILWAMSNYRRIQRRYAIVRDSPEWSHIPFIQLRTRNEIRQFEAVARELCSI